MKIRDIATFFLILQKPLNIIKSRIKFFYRELENLHLILIEKIEEGYIILEPFQGYVESITMEMDGVQVYWEKIQLHVSGRLTIRFSLEMEAI